LLNKLGAEGNMLLVVANKEAGLIRSTRNIGGLQLVQANYLNVYDVTNADMIIIEKTALEAVSSWLGGDK
jgi:ribosomal protein L4